MPLKTAAQLSSLAEYKKLLQADARVLNATGAKFLYFSKFIFPDKSFSPIILFGLLNPAVVKGLLKQCSGPASGTATINGADQIELEVGSGQVQFAGLSRSLAACGVTRKLAIPLGASDESGEGGEKEGEEGTGKTVPPKAPPTPLTGQPQKPTPSGVRTGMIPAPRPVRPQPQQPPIGTGVKTATTGPKTGPGTLPPQTPPTTQTPPKPTPSGVRTGMIPPPRPVRPQPQGVTGPTGPTPLRTKTEPTPQAPPLKSTPTTGPSVPKPGTPPPGGTPVQKGPTTTTPQTSTPPKQPTGGQPPQKPTDPPPTMVAKRLFDTRFKDLAPRLKQANAVNPNGAYVAIGKEMIAKAKLGDFKAALAEAAKLDVALSKATFQKGKAQQQQNRSARLGETFGAVKKSYFTPGSADRLAKEKLDAGTHFKAFLKAQKDFETARDEKTLDALEAAASAYVAHFGGDFSDKDKAKKENVRKNEICTTALKGARHYRLALAQDKIGAPPWNEEQEIKSAEIYSKLLFEQGDKEATPNSSSGVSGSFWLEETVWGDQPTDTKMQKTFIFKPTDAEADVPGFPKGGSAAREVMGKAVSDQLQAQMGLDFGTPETSIIAVDAKKVPLCDDSGTLLPQVGTLTGSVQHFSKSEGELGKRSREDPTLIPSIADEEVHKMAVLDLVQLNMDRHSGNFMVDRTSGATKLVPIDNGLALPSREGLNARRNKMGAPHNALGDLPQSQKKMSPEMVEKIKQIDPDEVVAGMKKSFDAMKKLHPEAAAGSEIKDENFDLTKRSILFMKRAAGELTIAEIQDAYVTFMEKIFDTPPDKMEAGFDEAIKAAKARTPALQEFAVLKKDWTKVQKELQALGWGMDLGTNFEHWARLNATKVLKIHKAKTENPAARRRLNDLLKAVKSAPADKVKAVDMSRLDGAIRDLEWIKTELSMAAAKGLNVEDTPGGKKGKDLAAKPNVENASLVEMYEQLGGTAALKKLEPKGEKLTLKERVTLMTTGPIKQLGGVPQLEKIHKLYPRSEVDTPARQLITLKAYEEYQRLGGDKEYYRLGGNAEVLAINQRLEQFKMMQDLAAVA